METTKGRIYLQAINVVQDIMAIQGIPGHCVCIVSDNRDAEKADMVGAVDVLGDFTDYQTVRCWGRTWQEALRVAAEACRKYPRGVEQLASSRGS